MNRGARRAAAFGLLFGTIAICLACIPGLIEYSDVENEGAWGFRGMGPLVAMIFALAGALLATKRPDNAVGWLFGAVGLAFALITAGETYAVFPLLEGNDAGIRYQVAWITSWAWVTFLGLLAFSILLFPSGKLPSKRWTRRAWLIGAGFVLGCVSFAVAPGHLNNMPPRILNRYALPEGLATEVFVNAGMILFLAALVTAAVGVVQRYRSSRGLQRQQMKLFAFAAAGLAISMVLVVIVVLFFPRYVDILELLSTAGMLSIPIAMTFAILRYRLYDIDVIINRALVYGAVSGVLAAVYLGGVVLLQQVLAPVTADSDMAIAASTLAVAALFRPLRTRTQTFIDRRFYRSRYDAAETLSHFSARLRNEVDLEALGRELLGVIGETMEPAHASLWLKRSDGVSP